VTSGSVLAPHLPRVLAAEPARTTWTFDGSVLFADVSGFTKLSENLATLGKAGAEELTLILNRSFADLLQVAFTEGGDLLSYGGDALLLAFEGDHHADRAVRAAIGMRSALRARGPVHTDAGRVRLRISQGVHSGQFQVVVAGSNQRELMLIGSGATTVTDIETAADPGDVLMSSATAELLAARCVGGAKAGHVLARSLPAPAATPAHDVVTADDRQLEPFLPPAVRERIQSGGLDPEHRFVGVAFVQVLGVDAALADRGAEQTTADLGAIVDAAERAAAEHGTCLLASDIAPDGVKLIVTAGAPTAAEDGEGALLTTIRTILDHDFALPVRAGAHAGHVFAGEVGAPDRRVYTVIGDTVNLAARLMGKANPGELVASASMLASAGARFEQRSLEPFFVKGKRHAQHAAVIGDRIDDGSQVGWEDTPFVGRADEFAMLEDARSAARSGRGSVVDIVGGPGVGKSRLLHRFLDDAAGWQIIRTSSEPYQSGRPFFATRLTLRSVLDVDQQADPAEAGGALLRRLGELDPELVPFAPLLAQAIDAEVPMTPEVDDLATEFRMQRLQELVGRVMALALVDPTILVFEDANFMDGSSRDVFEYALRFVHLGPWLVVVTRRDTDSGLHDGLDFPSHRLELAPLDGTDLLALAHQICERRPIPADELDELVERAQGNPLFLIELVQARMESDGRTELPTTLEGIIAARLDRLAADDRRMLRHVAVLGDRFPLELAQSVLSDLVPQIADPRSWRRLGEFIVTDQDDMRFSHSLLREVAYEGLPFARRRLVHRRLAETLEIQPRQVDSLRLGLLALHYDLAGMHREAYRYCRRAGERAGNDGANIEATALLERAIENARRCGDIPSEQLSRVAEVLADVAELAARYDTATTGLRLARSLRSDDSAALARLSRKEGVIRERTGHFDAALRWYRTGRKHAELLDEPFASSQRGDLMLATAGVAMHQGKLRACVRWAQRALQDATAAGNRRAEAHAYYLLESVHTDLGNSEASRYRGRSLAIFEEIGDLAGLARALGNLSVDARYEGRWDDALELAGRSSEALQRLGDVTGLAMSQYNAAEVLQDQGRLADADEMLVNARRTWRAAGFTLGVGAATGALGRIALRSGDDERAIALIDEAIAILDQVGADSWVAELSAHRIEADLFAGRWADVIQAVPVGQHDRASGQDAALRSKLLRFRGVAEAAIGEPDAAQTLERAIWYAREAESAYEEALARLELADLGDAAFANEHRAIAEQILEGLGVTHPQVLIPQTPQRAGDSLPVD
jgi:class 3 adenylate cyclase/tetratricopeptide (TPR) repeat protein